MRRRLAALIILLLLAGLVGGMALWLRAQQRQYALNRALIAALMKFDDRRALALVEAGADPNTPYNPAPVPSLPELVKQFFHRSPTRANNPTAFLIACGADWWEEKYKGWSIDPAPYPPEWPALIETMLRSGADVNSQYQFVPTVKGISHYDITALMCASFLGHRSTMRLLLKYGASVNGNGLGGLGPLHDAVASGDREAIRLLLDHGANPNLADKRGVTPLKIAQMRNSTAIVALLKQYGARETGT